MNMPDTLQDDDVFNHKPDPDHLGWLSWALHETDRYNSTLGPMWARLRGDGITVVRTEPGRLQGNIGDNVHSGAMLTQIDIALFVAARMHGSLRHGPGVTLNLDTQFIGAGRLGEPLDAEVEILHETGRLLFLRGLLVQASTKIAAFSGTIRKTPGPRS